MSTPKKSETTGGTYNIRFTKKTLKGKTRKEDYWQGLNKFRTKCTEK
jgi:hypothetical protein